MNTNTNLKFQKKFDSVADSYEKISNQYTLARRKEALETNRGELFLEVGAATGIITEHINDSVICTDISFQMCKQAKMKQQNVVCCDAEALPFRTEQFDVIISSEMIYYLKDPKKFLSHSYKILKSNGRLLISMANENMAVIDQLRSWLRKIGIKNMYFDDGLRKFLSLRELEAILKEQNFVIESVEKKVIFPFSNLDSLNRFLEKTRFSRFGLFIIIKALKISKI